MSDLCPKGTDLGVKTSSPSCPLTLPLPLYPGLTTERVEGHGNPLGRVVSLLIEFQTTLVPMQPQTTLGSIGNQAIKVKKTQTTKSKAKIQDREEDETEDKKEDEYEEKQVSLIYPWEHMRRVAREEQLHNLLPLQEATTGKK